MNPTASCRTCGVPKSSKTFYYHSPGVLANECKECKKKRNNYWKVRHRFGMTVKEWEEMRARGCAVCGSNEKVGIDHDHRTGRIRGPLCDRCNRGIGYFKDDVALLARAIEYLAAIVEERKR